MNNLREIACPHRVEGDLPRRPANALNVEIGSPLPRCALKSPSHWGADAPSARRWLLSGGSPFVFGVCSANCPDERRDAMWATYEIIRPGEAIVTLTVNGEWSGSGLVSVRSKDPSALYEAAYRAASVNAISKGGRLDRFSEACEPRARDAA